MKSCCFVFVLTIGCIGWLPITTQTGDAAELPARGTMEDTRTINSHEKSELILKTLDRHKDGFRELRFKKKEMTKDGWTYFWREDKLENSILSVHVSFLASVQEATALFNKCKMGISAGTVTSLQGIGDEAVLSQPERSGACSVFFRKAKFFVLIDSSSRQAGEALAKYVAGEIKPKDL